MASKTEEQTNTATNEFDTYETDLENANNTLFLFFASQVMKIRQEYISRGKSYKSSIRKQYRKDKDEFCVKVVQQCYSYTGVVSDMKFSQFLISDSRCVEALKFFRDNHKTIVRLLDDVFKEFNASTDMRIDALFTRMGSFETTMDDYYGYFICKMPVIHDIFEKMMDCNGF